MKQNNNEKKKIVTAKRLHSLNISLICLYLTGFERKSVGDRFTTI